jgi:E3 ubiquitin-protein ligase RNF115/126
MFADDGGDDSSMPDLDEPLRGHNFPNPHAHDDPEEDDISNLQFRQTAPGRFNVQATITRSVSPQQFRAAGGMAPATIGGFMSMLTGLAAGQVQGQQTRGPSVGPFSRPNQNQNRSFSEETRSSERANGQPRVHASRFTYTGGARLYPRDANNPEPHVEPVDEITKYVECTANTTSMGLTNATAL